MQPTTRSRILDYFRKQQVASARELSLALGMTAANIRHHLSVLESNGLIEVVRQQREGRGRPVDIYGLSRRELGDGLGELAGAMFDVWVRNATEEARTNGLRSMARQLAGDNLPDRSANIQRRLALAVDRLNQLHYQARWEASVAGPRVVLGYCPFSAIIASYPELCTMDAFLLGAQLGQPVTQTAKLQSTSRGLPFCLFVMQNKQ
jgi:predicted ArsR family transcriptional regulator